MTGTHPAASDSMPFADRLDAAMQRHDSLVCVGLDPHVGRTPEPIGDYCRRLVDRTIEYAVAYKPNSAFFEAIGVDGPAVLRQLVDHIAGERIVVLDAKRGDIGSTAEAYAHAAFEVMGADAVTVSPYLGEDAVEPFLSDPRRGAFVLCHTSNPGARDFQALDVGGHPLYVEVARRAAEWGPGRNVGLVVGATFPAALAVVRSTAPDIPFLVPGIGAQGGDLGAALSAGLDERGRGLLVTSSRAVFYAPDPAEAARELRDAVNAARARRIP